MAITPEELPPDNPLDESHAPPLTLQQREVHRALIEKDGEFRGKRPSLAGLYLGAVLARVDPRNPDRLALASHDLRELMEKLPRHLDVPYQTSVDVVGEVQKLSMEWKRIRAGSGATGYQDRAVQFFEERLGSFFELLRDRHTPISKRAGELIDRLDPRKKALPPPIKRTHEEQWKICERYFLNVSHHRTSTEEDEFDGYVEALESFLLDRLRPRTFEDQSDLKRIIEEGERHA